MTHSLGQDPPSKIWYIFPSPPQLSRWPRAPSSLARASSVPASIFASLEVVPNEAPRMIALKSKILPDPIIPLLNLLMAFHFIQEKTKSLPCPILLVPATFPILPPVFSPLLTERQQMGLLCYLQYSSTPSPWGLILAVPSAWKTLISDTSVCQFLTSFKYLLKCNIKEAFSGPPIWNRITPRPQTPYVLYFVLFVPIKFIFTWHFKYFNYLFGLPLCTSK